MGRGTRDGPDEKPIARVEKRLERAQEEIGGEGNGVEGGTCGREEDCIGAVPLRAGPDSERRKSAKLWPFRRAVEIVILSRVWMSRAHLSSKYVGLPGDAALWGPLQLTHRKGAEQLLE